MARKKSKRKRKKSSRKVKANSAYDSLCALAPLITSRKIFDHIHQMVKIPQKKVDYSPSDKLVFVVIGIMSGCELDGGFGTDENINYALWRDYHLLVKMYSGNRAKVLAKSVQEWVDISPGPDNRPRQAGWVSAPHRYCRKTRQLATRMPKKKGDGCQYSILVTTDTNADLHATVSDHDGRSGVPESTFCQDNQGLGNRKRRKRGFVAQQMLVLLTQLAHNLIRWMQNWLTKAMERLAKYSTSDISSVSSETNSDDWWVPASAPIPSDADLAIETLNSFGMKRFVRQVLCLSGVVVVRKGKVRQVKFNPLYPLISRITIAFEALLTPYGIAVSLYEI